MQSYSGKRKNSKSFRRPFKRSIACFFALVTFVGCSHLGINDSLNEKEVLSALCLSGIGKGRIEHRANKYLFDYKAIHDQEKKIWTIGVDLPLSGQEILAFDYESSSATGPFAYRLSKQDRNGDLLAVYGLLGELLAMVDKQSLSKGWKIKNSNKGKIRLTNGKGFNADFFAKKSGRFRRTVLSFSKKPNDLFRLQLFSDSCSIK